MNTIQIGQVADSGERCWGVRLLDEEGVVVVESTAPLTKAAANGYAKALKHGDGGAATINDEPADESHGAVASTDGGGVTVKFAMVDETTFRLCGPPGGDGQSLEVIQDWFVDAEIIWDPPEEDPAHRAKDSDHTVTKGLPGSGVADPKDIESTLGAAFHLEVANVPELEHPVAIVFDYSPTDTDRPLSFALGLASERKCWLTTSKVQQVDGIGPNPYPNYREFCYAGRRFHPYSIEPIPTDAFGCVSKFESICRGLYAHVVWQ